MVVIALGAMIFELENLTNAYCVYIYIYMFMYIERPKEGIDHRSSAKYQIYQSRNLPHQNPRCRLCRKSKTIQNIVRGCKMQTGTLKNNQVAGIVYRHICSVYKLSR